MDSKGAAEGGHTLPNIVGFAIYLTCAGHKVSRLGQDSRYQQNLIQRRLSWARRHLNSARRHFKLDPTPFKKLGPTPFKLGPRYLNSAHAI